MEIIENKQMSKTKSPQKSPSAKKAEAVEVSMIKVTQVGSAIGRKHDQEKTLIGLGLNKLQRSRVLESTPSVHGMINKVKHLVKVEAA